MRIWRLLFAAHSAAAAVWWWMMPGGFPWWHPRFWINEALPPVVFVACLAICVALHGRRQDRWAALVIAVPIAWTSALVSACFLFPESRTRFLPPLAALSAVLWIAFLPIRSALRPYGRIIAATAAIAVSLGLFGPWSQRGPDAGVRPLGDRLPPAPRLEKTQQRAPLAALSDEVRVVPGDGSVIVRCGKLTIDVRPLLTFESVSPDRCWTIFAPEAARRRAERRLTEFEQTAEQTLLFFDGADGRNALRVTEAAAGRTRVDAFSQLSGPIYSHLNTYCELWIHGHQRLSVAFSPCPRLIAVEPTDYPIGRPARFAYLDAGGMFHAVEARSGEKGPFRELAAGALNRSGELGIGLYDGDRMVARIVFEDWAAQADTQLSPTAGWGVPTNAIEFARSGDAPDSLVMLWVTLAATSVGRGWDSVGHAPGVYRNRMRIESIAASNRAAGNSRP